MLVDAYKKNEQLFQSSTIRNDTVWKMISEKLKANNLNFGASQCENKFKNLKRRYQKKKDNMKPTASGAAVIKFEFYNEMEELFGKKPNIEPLAIASSSRENIVQNNSLIEKDLDSDSSSSSKKRKREGSEKTKQKKKKTKSDKLIEELNRMENNREERRRKRHEEMMNSQLRVLKVFEETMNKLIEKL
nr:uncharacterized protein LOC111420402 [Onthophagus taurus]